VFNTPGANANAVAEMVLAGMLLSCRNIIGGVEWARTLKGQGAAVEKAVEKGKKAFVGPEIRGKTLGVVGLGAIGVLVANAAVHLGMNVIGYDPMISVEHAWKLSRQVKRENSLDALFSACDFITLHVPLNDKTRAMVGVRSLSLCRKGLRIMNFARGGLVDDAALIDALGDGRVSCYVTDFPSDALIGVDGVIAIPHLGASTPESEENCAVMAARELVEYLENGNIVNAVNLPSVSLPRSGVCRVCIIHKNVPTVLTSITSSFSAAGMNIENLINKSRRDMAYSMMDLDTRVSEAMLATVSALPNVIRVRALL
jgi:D-3-phosphoglycerate dehydrogenase